MGFQVPLLIYRRVHCTISDSCLPLNSEMKKYLLQSSSDLPGPDLPWAVLSDLSGVKPFPRFQIYAHHTPNASSDLPCHPINRKIVQIPVLPNGPVNRTMTVPINHGHSAIGIQAIAKIVSLRHPTTFKQPLLFRLRLNSSIGRRSFRISSFSPDISKSSQPPTGRSSHR